MKVPKKILGMRNNGWKRVRGLDQMRWESKTDQVFVGRLPKGYRAGSIYTSWEKKAKTKKQAISFAREFMRKNK